MSSRTCRDCNTEISFWAGKCKNCGARSPAFRLKHFIALTLVYSILASLLFTPLAGVICFILFSYISFRTMRPAGSSNSSNSSNRIRTKLPPVKEYTFSSHLEPTPAQQLPSESYQKSFSEFDLWEGETKPAAVTVSGFDERLKGIFTRLSLNPDDGNFYLDITNTDTGEITTFNERRAKTLFLVGSTRYDFSDLCRKIFKLDLSDMYGFARTVRRNSKNIAPKKTFTPIRTTFSYCDAKGDQTRRTVRISSYSTNRYGQEYISGYCELRGEMRTFLVENILTMMHSDGYPQYQFKDWITNVAPNLNDDS